MPAEGQHLSKPMLVNHKKAAKITESRGVSVLCAAGFATATRGSHTRCFKCQRVLRADPRGRLGDPRSIRPDGLGLEYGK